MSDEYVLVELSADTRQIVADYLSAMEVGVDKATYETAKARFESHVRTLPEPQALQAAMEVMLGLVDGDIAE